ncbi:MAG: starch-binding protein, partial [Ruminococcus sp.]|nr:starch-binding protein [Ruminococcus sp.]
MSKQAKKLRKIISFVLTAIIAVSCFSVSASAVAAEGPNCTCSTLISDSLNWGKMFVYQWDAEGNALTGEWPGIQLFEKTKDDYGDDAYYCSLAAGVAGMVFNNGDGAQTVDVTELNSFNIYITGEQEPEYGHYYVSFTSPSDPNKNSYLYGDVDLDGVITISDSTTIAFYLAQFEGYGLTDLQKELADTDGDGTISIADVTAIQFWLAELGSKGRTGQKYISGSVNPATETTSSSEKEIESSFLLTDNLGWGTAYVYAWDEDGNALNGEWPGDVKAETITNAFGENIFIVDVPKGAAGVIVNNGSNQQTEDITDFYHEYCWMDGTQNELGHYIVNYNIPCKDFCDIGFINSENWDDVYIYAQGITKEWPGDKMYKSGDSNNYSYSYPMWELGETIVFNNGKGVSTIGVSVIEDQTYYTKGEMNSNNRLIIYPNDGEDNFPAVYFTNHQGWSNVFAYAWDENGNALLGGWPGVQMTDEGINDYGEDIYSVIVPYGAVGLVFSSGDGDQTADVIRGNDGFKSSYYTTDERDEQGHLIVFAHY